MNTKCVKKYCCFNNSQNHNSDGQILTPASFELTILPRNPSTCPTPQNHHPRATTMSSASSSAFPRLPCTRMELTVHDMPNHRSQPISPQSILLDFSRLPKIAIIYQILNENTLQRQPIGFGVLNTTLETKPAWNRLIGGRRIAGRAVCCVLKDLSRRRMMADERWRNRMLSLRPVLLLL